MLPRRYTLFRSLLGCVAAGLAGWPSAVRAQDEKSKVDQAVDATRTGLQDLDLMTKGLSRTQAAEGKIDLNLSEGLKTDVDARPAVNAPLDDQAATLRERKKAWEARNWLLAGMREQSDEIQDGDRLNPSDGTASLADGRGFATSNTDTEFWLEAAFNSDQKGTDSDREPRKIEAQQRLDARVVNPLEGFMADWMAPEELDRLKESAGLQTGRVTFDPIALEGTQPAGNAADRVRTSASAYDVIKAPAQNPYLDGWGRESPTANAPGLITDSIAPLPRSPSERVPAVGPNSAMPPPVNSGASSPTAPGVNEAWKPPPRTDEKYFPRLKRF